MAEFAGRVGPVDEDGGVLVTITQDGEPFSRHYIWDYQQGPQWLAQELGILRSYDTHGTKECEHGLALALCNGPQHY